MIAVHQSGSTKSVVRGHVRRSGSTKALQTAWVRQSGSLVKIFDSFSASLSPASAFGSLTSSTTLTVYTNAVSVTVTGGVAPLTYAWTRTDGGGHTWSITNPSGATTQFSTSCARGTDWTATFQCVVTDSTGQSATLSVSAECINNYGF